MPSDRQTIRLLALALLLSAGCSSPSPQRPPTGVSPANVQPHQNDPSDNIARRILQLDAQVKPVTAQMFQTLDAVMGDACAAIAQLHRQPAGRWDRQYAEAALNCIDTALINHGFLYPEIGGVDQLADALTPFQMSAAQKPAFVAQPHNHRRASMIAQRFPGPFYPLDCDTAAFVYLGVAEQLNLPLHLVTIPSYNRHSGHTFVRWREGAHSLDWETMDGTVTMDDSYQMKWKINAAEVRAQSALTDLTSGQVLGCEHYLIAIQYEHRGDFAQALRELSFALDLYPQNLDARREFAWVTATAPVVPVRDDQAAIADAQFVLRLVDDPDARDTLAAAYASAGSFNLAVHEERAALLNGARTSEAKPGYQQRLTLYQQHTIYRQSGPPSFVINQHLP